MELTGITSISVTNLQSRLAQTLRWSSLQKHIILLTHWHQPTHVIIPISYLPTEIREMMSGLQEEPADGTKEKNLDQETLAADGATPMEVLA